MWPNTLPEVAALARELVRLLGEASALERLERIRTRTLRSFHVEQRGRVALGALRKAVGQARGEAQPGLFDRPQAFLPGGGAAR